MNLSPRTNRQLFGHDEAWRRWRSAADSGKLAPGWIIAGPKGIGKATFAFHMTRHLLAKDDETAARRIEAGGHSDLLVVEPLFDEKKGEAAQAITVEQAREVGTFLSLTAGEGGWRVVIIDGADLLNANAANAILKILEEPPPRALLALVCHQPGMLLPTLRSRASMLKLRPPPPDEFRRAVRLLYPEMEPARLQSLAELSGNSPGVAAAYEEQGALELYEEMLAALSTLPALDPLRIHALAERIAGDKTHASFQLFKELALALLHRLATGAPDMEDIRRLHPPTIWATKWQQALAQLSLAQSRHLDYRQAIILFFHSIASADGFVLGSAA